MTTDVIDEFQEYLEVYFLTHSKQRKFQSPENSQAIVARMRSYGLSVTSDTMVARAINELVTEKEIERTDGGSDASDRAAVVAAEKSRIDSIANAPLTDADYTRFAGMSRAQVQQAYYSDPVFAARYRKAASLWKFEIPPKPAPSQTDVSAENDPSEYRTLTAKEYHAIPAATTRRLLNDAGFRRAVQRLIDRGLIAALVCFGLSGVLRCLL